MSENKQFDDNLCDCLLADEQYRFEYGVTTPIENICPSCKKYKELQKLPLNRLIVDMCRNCVFLHQNENDGSFYCDKKVVFTESNIKGKVCYHKIEHMVMWND